jgi:hypothetical protein
VIKLAAEGFKSLELAIFFKVPGLEGDVHGQDTDNPSPI